MVRALLKRPLFMVLDHAAAVLDPASQTKVLEGILAERKGQGVVWALQRPELAERFASVLVIDHGRLAEQGRFEALKSNGGPLNKMLAVA